MAIAEEENEFLQLARLLPEISGGPNQSGETSDGNPLDGSRGEKVFVAKGGDGAFDVGPGGVLGQDGSGDDLETRSTRPPVLRPEGAEEHLVIDRKLGKGCGCGRRKLAQISRAAVAKTRRGRQNAGGRHLFRKIAMLQQQVKKEALYGDVENLFWCTGISEFRTIGQNRTTEDRSVCYVERWVQCA